MEDVLTILLAGGAGERLAPLTRDHAKPMMPFGGIYRLIDITLSNCINSRLNRIYVLTQHKALSLNQHIRETWNILSPELGQFIETVPPTQRVSHTWYLGTADAVSQNIQSIEEEDPTMVLILSADHIYKMHYGRMIRWHCKKKADVTVATTQVPFCEANRFGIVQMDDDCIIRGFEEKPLNDQLLRSAFNYERCSASMGVYLFSTQILLELLKEDAMDADSSHDFGRDILPKAMMHHRVAAYDFVDENKKEISYWRDVGTLESYYDANMDLVGVNPHFNLYDQDWPLRCAPARLPPAKTVFADEGERMGMALDSIISQGCIISGGRVARSILSPGVRINSHAIIEDSILFPGVHIGRRSRIHRAIVDHNILLPENTVIGLNSESDLQSGHFVTDSGLVIVHRNSPGVTFTGSYSRRRQPTEMP